MFSGTSKGASIANGRNCTERWGRRGKGCRWLIQGLEDTEDLNGKIQPELLCRALLCALEPALPTTSAATLYPVCLATSFACRVPVAVSGAWQAVAFECQGQAGAVGLSQWYGGCPCLPPKRAISPEYDVSAR